MIGRDVEALVLDPTDREAHAAFIGRLGCLVEEHPGNRVTAGAIDSDYRGPVPMQLARQPGGENAPASLAAASTSGDHDPQAVKWFYHCLA